MDPSQPRTLVDQRHRVLSIICASLLFSIAVYVAIAWFLGQQGSLPAAEPSDLPQILPMLLCAVAAMVVFGAQVLSNTILKQALVRAADDTDARVAAYQSATIVGMAMRESAAIIGLVLTFLSGEMIWVLALSAVAAAAMLLAWPRRDRMLEIARGGPMTMG